MSKGAKVWIGLWVVYIVWGSTYLGIELASETMPGVFALGDVRSGSIKRVAAAVGEGAAVVAEIHSVIAAG